MSELDSSAVSEHTELDGKSKSIFWRDVATIHHAGTTADLLAEAEVPSVASDMNVRTSLSGG